MVADAGLYIVEKSTVIHRRGLRFQSTLVVLKKLLKQ